MEDKTINIGPKRGAKVKKRWDPKEWRPEYEAMAALSATGMPHQEIAQRFGYKGPWVSMILNSPKGKIVMQLITNNIREAGSKTITSERVQRVLNKAFSRVESIIDDDDLALRSPMAIFGASMELLKKTPLLGIEGAPREEMKTPGAIHNTQINVFTPGVNRNEIDNSLKLANEVKQIHGPKDE